MRVLIVKLSALGDVVHALPAVRLLQAYRPGVNLTWVVEQRVAGILEGQGIDAVVPIDTRRLRADLRAGRLGEVAAAVGELRHRLATPFDLILDLQGNTKSGVVARLARGRRRVGLPRRLCREWLNTWLIAEQAPGVADHVVDQAGGVVAHALGIAWEGVAPPYLRTSGVAAAGPPRVALINGASWETKLWPVASFVALGQWLAARGFAVVVPWGDEREHHRAVAIASEIGPAAVVPPRGSLAELAALLATCRLAVGGDTGPTHIAWAVGTPTVSLYGPNPAVRNGPRGPTHRRLQAPVECSPCWGKRCPTNNFICMASITVEAVVAAAADLLDSAPPPRPGDSP